MSTQIVELTGDEAALLRSLDKVIQKQLDYERKLRDTAEQGDAAGLALQGALSRVQAEGDKALNGLLRELKTIGPEGSGAADALRSHLREAGKAGHRSIGDILAQIRLIDPEAAEAAASAAKSFDSAAAQSAVAWHEQLQILRGLGPEGAKAADEIERELKTAAVEASGGMEQVLSKLEELNPAVRETASRIRIDLGDAAKYSEREFGDVLDELRALGPEGRTAATEIRKHLVAAGKIGEKSMEDVASKLDKLDPESATAARQIITNLKTVKDEGGGIFESFSIDAIAKVGLVALAFDKIRDAIGLVNTAFQKQLELMSEARESHLDLAGAQQEALKNLANFSTEDQKQVLDVVVPRIQKETLFPSQKALTIGASNLASSGAGSVEEIEDFLSESAKVTRLTPDTVDEYAMGAFLVSKATGLPARQSMNLLFQGGANSQLVEPADVATTLPNALIAGFATSKITDENRQAATAQTAAFFGASTEFAVDQKGDSSRTNIGKLLGFLEKLTTDLPNDPGLPLDRLKLIQGNEDLKARYLKELPAEQAFLPSFRKLIDPNSDAFAALTSKVPRVSVGTEAVDAFEQNLALGTRAMKLALLDTTDKARSELSQLGDGDGAAGAMLSQLRKVTANTLRQNQTTTDFIIDEITSLIPTKVFGYDVGIEAGRLEGSTAAEEAVSAIRELGTLRQNLSDPSKKQNIALTMEALVNLIETSTDEIDPAAAASARQMITNPREFQDSAETKALLTRMAIALEAVVKSNAETAKNTMPQAREPENITPALSNLTP